MPGRAKKVIQKSAAAEPISSTAYNHVVESASLRDIKLINSSFYVNPPFFDRKDDVVLSVDKECTDCTDVENGTIVAFFSFELKATLPNEEGEPEEVMNASAIYLAAYDVAEDSQQKEAAAFCGRVGLFATYPYFRALVAHYAGDADLEVPALPLITSPPRNPDTGEQAKEDRTAHNEKRKASPVSKKKVLANKKKAKAVTE